MTKSLASQVLSEKDLKESFRNIYVSDIEVTRISDTELRLYLIVDDEINPLPVTITSDQGDFINNKIVTMVTKILDGQLQQASRKAIKDIETMGLTVNFE